MKMPPKKRDKDEGSKIVSRDIQTEHELFLQAFEKPTQIYRYLRTRNMISPVFLHRTLTYMKHRMSRNQKRRPEFKVDNMLSEKMNKSRLDRNHGLENYMSIMFLGFFDKSLIILSEFNDIVRVETILLEISHKKRKDSSSPYMQVTIGTSDVAVNPDDGNNKNDKIPAISIPTESFMPIYETPHNKSYILLLKVETIPKLSAISDNSGEPCSKQHKSDTKIYGSELVIFDKHSRCLLAEGEYELALSEISPAKHSSPKKHTTWEIIPDDINFEITDKFDNRFELFNKCPMLKFYLKWTSEPCAGYVEKPTPIIKQNSEITCINGIGGYNETERDRSNMNNSLTTNNNNNTIATLTNGITNFINNRQEERIQTVYQFIYNNNSRQQTEPCDDMHCPWCSLDCITLYSLLKHLKLCHARFTFTYVPVANGARIDVAINDMYDGSYTGSPHDLIGPAGCAFARGGPVRRTSVTNLLVCRPRRQKPSLTEFLELDENEINNQRPYITGHNRLYHHTGTCLPVFPKELDIDSEDESDPPWLQHKTMQMIDEFTDVNEGEKELMKMWNLHVMKHGYVGDCQLPIACDMFLDMRGHELLQKNLYRNFVLHMCSLFDYGLVSPEIVYKTIQKLQNILSTYQEGRKVIAESRESQLDYWLKTGIHKQAQQELKLKQQQIQLKYQKQNDGKSSGASSSSSNNLKTIQSNSAKYLSSMDSKKTAEKDKMKRDLMTDSHQSTMNVQRKRALINTQNAAITVKRRLSQLRVSPSRRRSVPSSEQPKKIPLRRKSIALFQTDKGNSSSSSPILNQPKTIPLRRKSIALFQTDKGNSSSSSPILNQPTMRKRIASIAKVDKH